MSMLSNGLVEMILELLTNYDAWTIFSLEADTQTQRFTCEGQRWLAGLDWSSLKGTIHEHMLVDALGHDHHQMKVQEGSSVHRRKKKSLEKGSWMEPSRGNSRPV